MSLKDEVVREKFVMLMRRELKDTSRKAGDTVDFRFSTPQFQANVELGDKLPSASVKFYLCGDNDLYWQCSVNDQALAAGIGQQGLESNQLLDTVLYCLLALAKVDAVMNKVDVYLTTKIVYPEEKTE